MIINNPKLTILCQLFYPELISTGQTLTELCEKLSKKGVEIKVLCAPPSLQDQKTKIDKEIDYKGIKIKRLWATRFQKKNILGKLFNHLSFSLSILLSCIFSRDKSPMLVLTNPPFLGILGLIIAKLKRRPFLYLVFDIYPETAINCKLLSAYNPLTLCWKKLNQLVYQHATKTIVIGRCMEKYVKQQCKPKYHHKITHIHVWCDDENIQCNSDKNPYIEKWGLENKFIILYSGNLGRFHDMETIMQSAKIIQEKDPNIIYLFIGDGHKKEWSRQYAKKENLKNTSFYNYVPREDIKFTHHLADIGLVTLNEGQEAFSVPGKTYGILASQTPVIAIMNSKSEIAQMLIESHTGLVTPNKNAKKLAESIINLKNNPKELKVMQKNAKEIIETKYSLNKASEKYYTLIKESQL